jgi:hypothetical protein
MPSAQELVDPAKAAHLQLHHVVFVPVPLGDEHGCFEIALKWRQSILVARLTALQPIHCTLSMARNLGTLFNWTSLHSRPDALDNPKVSGYPRKQYLSTSYTRKGLASNVSGWRRARFDGLPSIVP